MIGYAEYFLVIWQCFVQSASKNCHKCIPDYGEKISSLMNKESDSESVYGDSDKYINTKIYLYGDNVNINFHNEKIPKKKHHTNDCRRSCSILLLK